MKELEKDEIPTRITKKPQTAKESLKTIDDLRNLMVKVVGSTQFQDMENSQKVDFAEILRKAYGA